MIKKISLFFIVFFIVIVFAISGYYIEQKSETTSPQGTKTSITKLWYNPSMIRTDSGDNITVINYQNNTVLIVNKQRKTYSTLDMAKFKQMTGMIINMLKQFSKDKNAGIKVKVTGERKIIDGYKCYKVLTDIYGMKSESWVTKDINIPKDLFIKSYEMMLPEEDLKKLLNNPEFKKIEGFPVESTQTASFMGQSSVTKTKLIRFKKMTIPLSVFKIDLTGYQKKSLNMMGGK